MTSLTKELNAFAKGYVNCALQSSNDESNESGGEPLDKNYTPEDIAPECLERMIRDCKQFQEENKELIEQAELSDFRAGRLFWLDRNGHGHGFWSEYSIGICDYHNEKLSLIKERGELDKNCSCPYHTCQRLSDATKKYGEFSLYVGDDGKIYA